MERVTNGGQITAAEFAMLTPADWAAAALKQTQPGNQAFVNGVMEERTGPQIMAKYDRWIQGATEKGIAIDVNAPLQALKNAVGLNYMPASPQAPGVAAPPTATPSASTPFAGTWGQPSTPDLRGDLNGNGTVDSYERMKLNGLSPTAAPNTLGAFGPTHPDYQPNPNPGPWVGPTSNYVSGTPLTGGTPYGNDHIGKVLPDNSAQLPVGEAVQRAWEAPNTGGEYQSPQGQVSGQQLYGGGYELVNGQWVPRQNRGTMLGGLPPQASQRAQMGRQLGGMPQVGMVRDPMMMTGDAPLSQRPNAGGARPELILNPTQAPIGVVPNPMMRRMSLGTLPRYPMGTTNYFNQGAGGPGLGVTPQSAQAFGATPAMSGQLQQAGAMRAGVQVPNMSAYDVAWDALSPTARGLFLQSREARFGIPIADQLNEIQRQKLQGFRTPTTVGY